MYLVAICDDEEEELNKTEQMLVNYEKKHPGISFRIKRFTTVVELLRMVRENEYQPDLLLMDIYMPDKLGIDAAKELRDMGSRSKIIFLTTSREHALDAFGVNAMQYLVKPIEEKSLFEVLDKSAENTGETNKKYLLFRTEGKLRRMAAADILYCEAQGKTQCLYLDGGICYRLHITITEFGRMVAQYREFVKIGVSYVVNLEHVESLNARELQMDNRKKIYLPRGSYQPLREKYFDYYCMEED